MVDSQSAIHLVKNHAEHHPNMSNYHSWHGHNSLGDSPQHSFSFSRRGSNRGSMRKVLPAVPDMDTQISLASKMIDKKTSTPKGNHSYGPFFLEYSLLAEYNLLQKQKLPGVYVIPSYKSPLYWYGVIFVRQGIYQEGVFRFHIVIPENYPDGDCPRIIFDKAVYHPLVDPVTHELDVRRGFHKWKRNVNHIWQILLYARRIFYKIDPKDPLNSEAADLYANNVEAFKSNVQDCVQQWKERIYDAAPHDDPHYIVFAPLDTNVQNAVRQTMVNSQKEEEGKTRSSPNGYSFIEPGSLQIFSKDGNASPESS